MAVTLREVARLAGVSVPTVNQVLNGYETRFTPATGAKVRAAAQRLGYVKNMAASGLRERRSFLVGVLFLSGNYLYYDEFMRGVQERLLADGFAPIFLSCSSAAEQRRNLKLCLQRDVEGLLFNTAHDKHGPVLPEALRPLLERNFPLVEVFGHFIAGVPQFEPDYRSMARDATQELIQRGCRRIVHVTHDRFLLTESRPANAWNAWDCRHGYLTAMQEAGLTPVTVRHPLEHYQAAPGSFFVDAVTVVEEVLARQPDGVFFFNEEQLLAFYQYPGVREKVAAGLQLGFIDNERGGYRLDPKWVRRTRPVCGLGRDAAGALLRLIGCRRADAANNNEVEND